MQHNDTVFSKIVLQNTSLMIVSVESSDTRYNIVAIKPLVLCRLELVATDTMPF